MHDPNWIEWNEREFSKSADPNANNPENLQEESTMPTINLSVDVELKAALDTQAEMEERSLRTVILRAIREYLRNHSKDEYE